MGLFIRRCVGLFQILPDDTYYKFINDFSIKTDQFILKKTSVSFIFLPYFLQLVSGLKQATPPVSVIKTTFSWYCMIFFPYVFSTWT